MNETSMAFTPPAFVPSFRQVAGCYLLTANGLNADDESWLEENLHRHYGGDRKRFEQDANRCFIVANLLDPLDLNYQNLSQSDLLAVATRVKLDLQAALLREFPTQQFDIEIIGENGVSDEPLELCVTFSQTD